jgi:molybdopterin-binding protein
MRGSFRDRPCEIRRAEPVAGEVVEIKRGGVMCQVMLKFRAPSTMCSVMTIEPVDGLGTKVGDTVNVIAKAVNVLLTTDKG